jgi:hypothetical protein
MCSHRGFHCLVQVSGCGCCSLAEFVGCVGVWIVVMCYVCLCFVSIGFRLVFRATLFLYNIDWAKHFGTVSKKNTVPSLLAL